MKKSEVKSEKVLSQVEQKKFRPQEILNLFGFLWEIFVLWKLWVIQRQSFVT